MASKICSFPGRIAKLFQRSRVTSSGLKKNNDWGKLEYWAIMFRVGYYTGLIPYKFDKRESKWVLSVNGLQKAIAIFLLLVHALSIVKMLKRIASPQSSTFGYFQQAEELSALMAEIIFVHTFWGRKEAFRAFFESFNNQEKGHQKVFHHEKKDHHSKVCRFMLTLLAFSLVLFLAFAEPLEALHWSSWSSNSTYEYGITTAREFTKEYDRILAFDSLTAELFIYSNVIISAFYRFYNAFSDITPLFTAMLFRALVAGLVEELRSDADPMTIWKAFKDVKGQVELLNRAIGFQIGVYFLGNIPFFATDLVIVVDGSSSLDVDRVKSFYYILACLVVAVVSARAQYKATAIRSWLFLDGVNSQIPELKLQLMLHEVCSESENIALSAGGMFRITFGFIGTNISLILTYAVLAFQFQNASEEGKGRGLSH